MLDETIASTTMSKTQTTELKSFKRKTQLISGFATYFSSIDQSERSARLLLLYKERIKSLFEPFRASYNSWLAAFDETKANASLSEINSHKAIGPITETWSANAVAFEMTLDGFGYQNIDCNLFNSKCKTFDGNAFSIPIDFNMPTI
uniref:Uncharacterized protein n=1 Tax=Glossina pallidipes TaxID=7398 RepID=A0A1B0A7Z7_GLOPL